MDEPRTDTCSMGQESNARVPALSVSTERTIVQILVPSLAGGGAEFVARRWAVGLDREGYDIEVLLTHAAVESDALPGVPVHSISGSKGFLRLILAMRKRLLADRPAVVLSLMPFSNLVLLLAVALMPPGSRPRTLISEHTLHSRIRHGYPLNSRIQHRLAQFLYKNADACLAVSHPVGAELVASHGVAAERLWVVRNPILDEHELRNPLRGRVNGLQSISIVVPARLVQSKRPELALEVARMVALETGKTTAVHFYGTGPLRAELELKSRALGVPVTFHGWVERWQDHIPADGVVLLPSVVEGLGNVLVEAAAKSVPSVVSSRTLGAADALVSGLTGELSAGDRPVDYAKAVILATNMEIGNIGQWLKGFTGENAAGQLREIIEALLLEGKRDRAARPNIRIGRSKNA